MWRAPRAVAPFPTQRGTYASIRNVQRRLRGVVRALELPAGTSPHTLRHTWASALLSSAVPIFLVSRYACHATIQTTADQYGHLVPYSVHMAFQRISVAPQIMGGVPCIRGTRIPVAMLVRMVADGTTSDELLEEYPQLTAGDVREALRFAAAHVDQRTIALDHSA
jgi:uncharacterized protein (DUF433 family)